MKPTALITGASRGIGAEFARIFAGRGINLVITARNGLELRQLKHEIEGKSPVSVLCFEKDLSKPENVQSLFDAVKAENISIDYLVNNAGFGDYGYFMSSDWERQESMIDLNVNALTHLCHLFIREWKDRKSGRILNVSSTASFQPGPGMSVYYATKAFVSSFSQALHHELKGSGISVTTLCPGPTESHFAEAARVHQSSKLLRSSRLPSSFDVALFGYEAMMKGKSLVIHGNSNRFLAFLTRFVPRKLMAMISAKVLAWK